MAHKLACLFTLASEALEVATASGARLGDGVVESKLGLPRSVAGERSCRGKYAPVKPTGRGLGATPARRNK